MEKKNKKMNLEAGLLKCSACLSGVNKNEGLDCIVCHSPFHYLCLGIDETQFTGLSVSQKKRWTCPKCYKNTKQENTPARNTLTKEAAGGADIDMHSPESWITQRSKKQDVNQSTIMFPSGTQQHLCLTKEDIREVVHAELRSVLSTEVSKVMDRSISGFLQAIKTEITSLKSDISNVKESMDFINCQYEEIMKETQNTSLQCKRLTKEVETLQATNLVLNQRITQMEQHSRACNIEIQCLPEHRSENLANVTMQLATVVSCAIKEDDIHHCTRTAKLDVTSSRPRSVVVQMKSPIIRDRLLASVINFNKTHREDKLNSSHLGIGGEKVPIYVAEHLSPHNRELHKAARIAAKEKKYKFVWIRSGRVFVRKDETTQAILLKDLASVDRLP